MFRDFIIYSQFTLGIPNNLLEKKIFFSFFWRDISFFRREFSSFQRNFSFFRRIFFFFQNSCFLFEEKVHFWAKFISKGQLNRIHWWSIEIKWKIPSSINCSKSMRLNSDWIEFGQEQLSFGLIQSFRHNFTSNDMTTRCMSPIENVRNRCAEYSIENLISSCIYERPNGSSDKWYGIRPFGLFLGDKAKTNHSNVINQFSF